MLFKKKEEETRMELGEGVNLSAMLWTVAEMRFTAFYRSLATLLLLAIVLTAPASATMYAYLDAKGNRHYRDVKEGAKGRQEIATASHYYLLRECHHYPVPNPAHGYGVLPVLVGSGELDGYIQTAAMVHQVDPLLVKAVIKAESNFNTHAVSSKGAQGLMQLMPSTAGDLRVANPFDPQQNINGGTRFLRSLLDSYNGNVELSLAAYNAGPKQVEAAGGIPRLPEIRNYIARVLQNYRAYKTGQN